MPTPAHHPAPVWAGFPVLLDEHDLHACMEGPGPHPMGAQERADLAAQLATYDVASLLGTYLSLAMVHASQNDTRRAVSSLNLAAEAFRLHAAGTVQTGAAT